VLSAVDRGGYQSGRQSEKDAREPKSAEHTWILRNAAMRTSRARRDKPLELSSRGPGCQQDNTRGVLSIIQEMLCASPNHKESKRYSPHRLQDSDLARKQRNNPKPIRASWTQSPPRRMAPDGSPRPIDQSNSRLSDDGDTALLHTLGRGTTPCSISLPRRQHSLATWPSGVLRCRTSTQLP